MRRLIFMALALLIVSCAAHNGGVRLAYSPVSTSADCNKKIAVLGFKDARNTSDLGVSGKTALHSAGKAVDEWITDALASEIEARGCEVDRSVDQGSPFPPDFIVTGEISRLYLARDFWSYNLAIALYVEARQGGPDRDYVFRKQYEGEWQKKTFGKSESESEILAAALEELLGQKIMPELAAKLLR